MAIVHWVLIVEESGGIKRVSKQTSMYFSIQVGRCTSVKALVFTVAGTILLVITRIYP